MSEAVAETVVVRDAGRDAPLPRASDARNTLRVVMLQTQAEAAGAQEISRILGSGLTSLGHEIHHVFCFRRTAAFDNRPNTFFSAPERPRGPFGVARMVFALVRYLKALQPDAIVCFQHYGNVVGILAAR